jgi:ribose transport system ATP-binding protein
MTGQSVSHRFSRQPVTIGPEALRCEGLTRTPAFKNVSFDIHEGEIVGLTGLVGSGRSALVRCIFGIDRPESGTVYVNGKAVSIHSPGDAIALNMGLLPERRQDQALLLEMTARENMMLVQSRDSGLLIDDAAETSLVNRYARRLRIRIPTPEIKAKYLSGGTQQKIVLSRWLAVHSRILIFDEPTHGIDVGARIEIYRLLGELAAQGIAILVISSEFAEIVGLCDRALVMRDGELVAKLQKAEITEQALIHYAMGDRA